MRVPLNALQNKLVDTLKVDAAGWTVSASIYDEVPENAAFPYVEMGVFTDVADGSKGLEWTESSQTFMVHSQARGAKEMNSIVNQVIQSMTAATLRVVITEDFEIRDNQYEQTQVFKAVDAQGDTFRRADVRIAFTVQDNTT